MTNAPYLRLVPDRGEGPRRFVVAFADEAWRVAAENDRAALFPTREDAIAFACEKARATAAAGFVGVVAVHGDIGELHCFTPPVHRRL